MADEIHEECGVIGVFNGNKALDLAVLGLHALQHRGQESAGVAVSDGRAIHSYRSLGLVATMARKTKRFMELKGHICIGHTRYSTTGTSNLINSQPILIDYKRGQLAVAHNGNLINGIEDQHCGVIGMGVERRFRIHTIFCFVFLNEFTVGVTQA